MLKNKKNKKLISNQMRPNKSLISYKQYIYKIKHVKPINKNVNIYQCKYLIKPIFNSDNLFFKYHPSNLRLSKYKKAKAFLLWKKKEITLSLKEEALLTINSKINFCLYNKKGQINTNNQITLKDLLNHSPIMFSIRKRKLLIAMNLQKQYLYNLIDIISSLLQTEKFLYLNEIFSGFNTYNTQASYYLRTIKQISNCSANGILFFPATKNLYANLIWSKYATNFFFICTQMSIFYLSSTKVSQTNNFFSYDSLVLENKLNISLLQNRPTSHLMTLNLRQLLRRKYLFNFLKGQNMLWNNLDYRLMYYIFNRLINSKVKNFWALIFKKNSFNLKKIKHQKYKLKSGKNYLKYITKLKSKSKKQELSPSLLYIIQKLENKKLILSENQNLSDNLLSLRNYFILQGENKFNNGKSRVLSSVSYMNSVIDYDILNTEKIKNEIYLDTNIDNSSPKEENDNSEISEDNNENIVGQHVFEGKKEEQNLLHLMDKELEVEENNSNLDFTNFISSRRNNLLLSNKKHSKLFLINRRKNLNSYANIDLNFKRKYWKQKRISALEVHSHVSVSNLYKYFSLILGNNVSVIFINSLALAKFAYSYPWKKKSPQKFLNYIEREMIQRYKYVAVYIQDFIRVCFFSFLLKKPTFLANFMGFQLAHLPRNRKETKFIRFLIKVLKIFGAQRREVFAIKIEFKGRVNRWRRTKIIRATRGIIPFFQFTTRIEYGSGKSITRKGALGIRLWICYNGTFYEIFKDILLGYMEYSELTKAKTINKLLHKYSSTAFNNKI